MKIRPAMASIREEAGLGSSMPYICAFSKEGAALMTLGTTMSPSLGVGGLWRSRRVERRRVVAVIGLERGWVLLESALRLLAIFPNLFLLIRSQLVSLNLRAFFSTAQFRRGRLVEGFQADLTRTR